MRLIPTLATVLAVGPLSIASAQRLPPALQTAQTELTKADERPVHAGAKACLDANSVPGAELLLEVMDREGRLTRRHYEAGHYRDLTFDYVVKFTDPYARKRISEEIRRNRKNAFARQWAAEALGFYNDHDFGKALERALVDKDNGVKRWAVWSVGRIKYGHAAKKIAKLAGHKDDFVRANALEALMRLDANNAERFATACSEDKSAGVRCALLGAAPKVAPDVLEAVSIGGVTDKDWRPRLQAVENLATVKSKAAVDALIPATSDARSLVAATAHDSLQKLTGQPIRQPDVWRKWWSDNRATFKFPERTGKATGTKKGATFAGIVVDSDHVAFVLDKSYLMKRDSVSAGAGKTYDDLAQKELTNVLDKLPAEIRFNVYTYDEEVKALSKKPLKKTSKNVKRAKKFASGLPSGRFKDMWNVLEQVVSDPAIDTVYFISSGEADVGLYCHGNRIGRHLKDLNRFYKKTVHAIAYTEKEGHRWHVEQVAVATGGDFKSFN